MQLLPAAMQRKPPRRGALAQGGWGIAGQWPSCSAVLTDAGTDERLIDNACVQGEAPSVGSLRPALPLAHVTIVQGPSSLLQASIVPLTACRWRKIRPASRGASVAAAFEIPAPTARQTTRNPRPGPQRVTTTHKDYSPETKSASSSAASRPTTSAKPASAAASPAQSRRTAITFDQ